MTKAPALILAVGLVLAVVVNKFAILREDEPLWRRLDGSQSAYGIVSYDLGTYSYDGRSRRITRTAEGTVLYLNSQWIQVWESDDNMTLIKTSDVTDIKLSKVSGF
jgi:hypothetical protein